MRSTPGKEARKPARALALAGARASRAGTACILMIMTAGGASAFAESAAAASGSPTVLPHRMCRGLFIVPLRIGADASHTLEMLLDTGASRTYIDPRSLARVAGGRAAKLSVRDAWIGPHRLGKLELRALPMQRLSLAVGSDLDGILGFPAFRDVLLTLDYPAGEVRIASGRLPPPDGIEVFRADGKRPHLDAAVAGKRMRLLIDSGATGRLQVRRGDQLRWTVPPRPTTSTAIAGGFIIKLGGRAAGIARIGPLEFQEPIATVGSESQIGWHVLRHFVLTFDQRERRVRMATETQGPVRMAPLVGMGFAQEAVPEGLRVVRVFPETSASAAGLLEGDLVVAIDGKPVHPRGCEDPPVEPARTRHVLTYVRDGNRAEATIDTDVLIP